MAATGEAIRRTGGGARSVVSRNAATANGAEHKQADKPAQDANALESIAEAVQKLKREVESLRGVIDRLQDEVAWAFDNDTFRRGKARSESAIPMHITSMPRDPLAPDWKDFRHWPQATRSSYSSFLDWNGTSGRQFQIMPMNTHRGNQQ
jgi:hypothetical protein